VTGEKINEIMSISDLPDKLDIKGDAVTIDAMGCQTDIAWKIREKEADYVLPMKENQPETCREIKEYLELVADDRWHYPPADVWHSGSGKNHWRIEWLRGADLREHRLDERQRQVTRHKDHHSVPVSPNAPTMIPLKSMGFGHLREKVQ